MPFVVGFLVGGIVGLLITACMTMSSETQKQSEEVRYDSTCAILHNALWFISHKDTDAAYREISFAMMRNNMDLTDSEKELLAFINAKEADNISQED